MTKDKSNRIVITLAGTSGFCFGVDNAVRDAYRVSSERQAVPVYMLGPLIHNEIVVEDLASRGIVMAGNIDDIPDGAIVLVRTHGEPPATFRRLEAKNCIIQDCTCPFVTKIHETVQAQIAAGKKVIIVGKPNHPEVVGISGYAGDSAVIVSSQKDAERIQPDGGEWALVAQTTFAVFDYSVIVKVLNKKFLEKLQIFDTICNTTENRQKEAFELAERSDVMIVVGSKTSSNTSKLLETCLSLCSTSYLVEGPQDVPVLPLDKFGTDGKLHVGVTAGASTPERIIREVIRKMSEQEAIMNEQEQQEQDVSFSEMIDSIPQLHRGATVKGSIVRYDADNVYVDVHDKSEGRIPRHEFDGDPDFDLDKAIEEHSEIDVYVRSIRNSEMGKEILLSKARVDFAKYKALIEDAFNDKTPVSVKVVNVVKDGVIASYGGVDIYIHRTQLEMFPVEDLDPYRNQTLEILVTQYDPDKRRLRVSGSRRALLNAERRLKAEEVWKTIQIGNVYNGVVRSLTDFGAFVDIGGVDGLVHVSELSWNRIRHPSQIVSIGDEIEVHVKDFDPERKRISLGYKKIEDDPYNNIEERFPVGSTVHGTVVRMFPFGAFVEIDDGVDALCHISQISNVRLVKPNDVLTEGMEVDARVLEVSNTDRRISISIKAVEPIDPDYAAEEVARPAVQKEITEYIDGVTIIEKDEPKPKKAKAEAVVEEVTEEAEAVVEEVAEEAEVVVEEVAEEAEAVVEEVAEEAEAVVEEVAEEAEAVAEEAEAVVEEVVEKKTKKTKKADD